MKVEIEVDITQHVLDKYDVVAFREGVEGELFFSSGCIFNVSVRTNHAQLIIRPKAQWDEWPEWLTADWAVRDSGGVWFFGLGKEPTKGKRDWGWNLTNALLSIRSLRAFTNITPPTYDGPWQHSLIRNPHKGGE